MGDLQVSVIVPAYRCAATIGQAMQGLVTQTRPPDQIIVVDDGSPEDLTQALMPYRRHIEYIRKTNGGAASARNAGLDSANGDLIAFCDADDIWLPTKLQKQLDIFKRHPEVGLVSSRYLVKETAGEVYAYPDHSAATWDRIVRPQGQKVFEMAMIVWTSVVMFRREILANDRFDTTLSVAEDRDLWARLVRRAPIYLQSEPLTMLLERIDSLSRIDLDLDCMCMLRVIRRHDDVLGPRGRRRWEAEVYRRWAGTYLARGNPRRAVLPAMHRLTYHPLSPEGWWILFKSSVRGLVQRAADSDDPSATPLTTAR